MEQNRAQKQTHICIEAWFITEGTFFFVNGKWFNYSKGRQNEVDKRPQQEK